MLCLDEENSSSQKYVLCLDVVQIICDFCDLKTQIKLISTCQEYYEYLKIRKLNCFDRIGSNITQEVITQRKFNELRNLNAFHNSKITDVNHLQNSLTELYCSWKCGINQMGIANLKVLQKLNAADNNKITDVNHLQNTLIELNCRLLCGIDQKGISNLKVLRKLKADYNNKIIDVNHLQNTLTELDCRNNCGIDQKGISNLKVLQLLNANGNSKITDVNVCLSKK